MENGDNGIGAENLRGAVAKPAADRDEIDFVPGRQIGKRGHHFVGRARWADFFGSLGTKAEIIPNVIRVFRVFDERIAGKSEIGEGFVTLDFRFVHGILAIPLQKGLQCPEGMKLGI